VIVRQPQMPTRHAHLDRRRVLPICLLQSRNGAGDARDIAGISVKRLRRREDSLGGQPFALKGNYGALVAEARAPETTAVSLIVC
jgi:hypothetical protein